MRIKITEYKIKMFKQLSRRYLQLGKIIKTLFTMGTIN